MSKQQEPESTRPKDELRSPQQTRVQQEPEYLPELVGQETEALKEVAEKLSRASQSFTQQQLELRQLRNMQRELKDALTQIMQGIESVSSLTYTEAPVAARHQALPASRTSQPEPLPQKEDCGCGCVDTGCCCFEIVLEKVRGAQPQGILEPADSGDTSIPVPLINELEVRLFASIDNIGILIPSLDNTMGIRVPSLLAGGGPGLWVNINQVIGRVYLPAGTTRTITVDFQGQESEEGVERAVGFKDEFGVASGYITLDCCMQKIYPAMPTDLSFNYGGNGGTAPGMISIAFFARKVCC